MTTNTNDTDMATIKTAWKQAQYTQSFDRLETELSAFEAGWKAASAQPIAPDSDIGIIIDFAKSRIKSETAPLIILDGAVFHCGGKNNPITYGPSSLKKLDLSGWTCYAPGLSLPAGHATLPEIPINIAPLAIVQAALEAAAKVCATAEIPIDIDVWLGTKKELSAATANGLSVIIRAINPQSIIDAARGK